MKKLQIKLYLHRLEKKLLSHGRAQGIRLTTEWFKQFPKVAGVYILRENGQNRYVGETGSIRARMNDLRNTLNHVLRRNIGIRKYKDTEGFEKATSYKKFNPGIEAKLNLWIEKILKYLH